MFRLIDISVEKTFTHLPRQGDGNCLFWINVPFILWCNFHPLTPTRGWNLERA